MNHMEKKKKIKTRICFIIAVMFIIIALAIPFVFAISLQASHQNQFFSVDSLTKTAGSTLEMKINLEKISYHNFLFTLTSSNQTLKEINVDNTNSNAEVEKGNSSMIISGNKEAINVNEIKLYYPIPADAKVGETFTFQASIEEVKGKASGKDDIQDNINGMENGEISLEQSQKEVVEITVTIIELANTENKNDQNGTNKNDNENDKQEQNKNPSNNESNKQEQNKNPSNNDSNKEKMDSQNANNQKINNNKTLVRNVSVTRIGNSSSGQSEVVTYNGSGNNYLKKLSVKEGDLTTKFAKENATYFIKLEEDVTSLNITATAEHSEAKVCISGNENIKDGSKVLISVTAENGSVRTYRIYVSK